MTLSEADIQLWAPSLAAYIDAFPDGVQDAYGYRYFLPVDALEPGEARGELIIGYAGADSIEFRLRAGQPGIWAYHPMEARHQFLGDDVAEVVNGWMQGTLKV